jgi:hypothetical protein
MDLKRITLFADDPGDQPSNDYAWVDAWLQRWKGRVRVVNYSSGGWEHLWNVEAPSEAVAEVPEHLLCESEWSNPELAGSPRDLPSKQQRRSFQAKSASSRDAFGCHRSATPLFQVGAMIPTSWCLAPWHPKPTIFRPAPPGSTGRLPLWRKQMHTLPQLKMTHEKTLNARALASSSDSQMPNKRIECAPFGRPTRKQLCCLLAAHSRRWAV